MPASAVNEPAYVGWINGIALFNWGQFGVGLFFMISGFVIPFSFRRYSRVGFALARFFRLWPTYAVGFLLAITAVYIGDWLVGGTFPYSAREIATHSILGLRQLTVSRSIDGVIWTLEIEIAFYLVCLIIAPWLRDGFWGVFLVPAFLFVGCLGLNRWTPDAAIVQHIKAVIIANSEFIVFMFAGVAFNFLLRQCLSAEKAFTIAGAALFAFLCLITIGGIGSLGWSYAAAVLVFCLAMVWTRWVPDGPVWRFLSDISYPLYIIHVLLGYVLMEAMLKVGADPSLTIAVATIVAILCAWLLHVIVELPSHNLGRDSARRLYGHSSG